MSEFCVRVYKAVRGVFIRVLSSLMNKSLQRLHNPASAAVLFTGVETNNSDATEHLQAQLTFAVASQKHIHHFFS